ncbi:TonB-dependent receptor [Sphingosinicellaceae bacterium]|nr:TonB-dependent receptor [Sphingosinicellaceae bacterium]
MHYSLKRRLLASTIVAGTAMMSVPTFAQTVEAPIAPAPTEATKSATSGQGSSDETIVVTGSRIPRPELASASPVTVVGAAQIKQFGTTRVEDLLNSLPQVFAGQGGSISNGATGTATIDLRDLGPSRTLVLINGRRLISGDPRTTDQAADINLIPASLIKRIDVSTGGASSVYGADAVSGVVNFVMDTEFDGFKLDSQYSLYNHDNRAGSDITDALKARGYGYPSGNVTDGATYDATAVFGAGFDDGRGHVTAYAGYRRINSVSQDRRDYSACSLSANSTASVAAGGRKYTCGGSGTSPAGSFYQVDTKTYYHVEGNQFAPGRVLYNFAPTNYYQRPDERYTAGFFAHYDVADAFKPYMEFMFQDDRTVAQIAPSGDFFNTGTINCDNPLLSAQQQGIICTPGNTTVDDRGVTRAAVYVGRRNVEGGGRRDDLQHTTYRGVIGAKGEFAKGFSYDAYYQYSRVDFAQTYRNDFSISRLGKALDVVDVGGVPTCRSVVDGSDPACVPYNIFTTGGVTSAALNYLQIPLFSRGQTSEQVADASVTFQGGEYGLTSPLANEGFAMNVGGEYRKETLNYEVDTNFLSGDGAGQGGPTTPNSGTYNVKEGFVEASLPLVQEKPFFYDLRASAGYRYSHYDIGGGINKYNTDTYKFEGSWAPVRDLKFRASYNRAVRSPNLSELFAARSIGLDGSSDPCAVLPDETAPRATAAQCALTGVSAAQYGTFAANPAGQYNGQVGGNPDLKPEISDSYTGGVVLTPSFLRGFQATVDYFQIQVKQQIGVIGADTIINSCISGNTSVCGLIVRGASGRLDRPDGYVIDTNLNTGKVKTAGIDVTMSYSQPIGRFGTLGASLVGTYLDKFKVSPIGSDAYECSGHFGAQCGTPLPKWRHNARLTWTLPEGVSVSGAWRYFRKVSNEDAGTTAVGGNPGNDHIAAQSYFDLSLTVPVADKFTFRIGTNNLLDRQPPVNGQALPVTENGNTFPQVYDALGRYIYVGVTLDL